MTPATLVSNVNGMALSSLTRLPPEVLFAILHRLDDPRDLYYAGLVNHAWRDVAVDDRLWEEHFWRFYRPSLATDADDDEILLMQYRNRKRCDAMLDWVQQTAVSPPSLEMFEIRSHLVWQAFKDYERIKNTPRPSNVSQSAYQKVLENAGKKYAWLYEDYKPSPTVSDKQLTAPRFLVDLASDDATNSECPLPEFHRLFASRLNQDDKILKALCEHLTATSHTLQKTLRFVGKHGSAARSVLAALAATQRITDRRPDLGEFLPGGSKDSVGWPRAVDLHFSTTHFVTKPHPDHCLALLHEALKALHHLQRREAIQSLQTLADRQAFFEGNSFASMRDRIIAFSEGVEQAMENVALFRAGEPIEVREYLDLLALLVSTDLQAEDRATHPDYEWYGPKKWYGPEADLGQTLPANSTRQQLSRIVACLHRLGFGAARGQDASDVDNNFINVVLYAPCQRLTSPMTLAAIVCAVARRLGIAATISNIAARVTIISAEDGKEPAAWQSCKEKAEWKRFFVDPTRAAESSERRTGRYIIEIEEVERLARRQGSSTAEVATLLDPASPLAVLDRVASNIMRATTAQRSAVERIRIFGRFEGEDDLIGMSACGDPLGHLRLFMEGRLRFPPTPLLRPVLVSSFSSLPSTRVHGLRGDPIRLSEEAEYCANWIRRVISPQQAGGVERTNETLARTIGSEQTGIMLGCDYRLLLQVDGQLEGTAASADVNAAQDGSSSDEDGQHSDRPSYFVEFLLPLIQDDQIRGLGLGSTLAADAELRKRLNGTNLPRRLVDKAYPSNKEVKLGVGALLTHRQLGWHAVVVGWDPECRKCGHWIHEEGVDSLPGGRYQPFYHCITECGSDVYVPQCDAVPLIIPAGTTREKAIDLLQDCTRLLDVPTLGRAFRTLRVVPWDAESAAQKESVAAKSKSKLKKEARKEEKRRKASEKEKGQVYLELNAFMKVAWPYD